MRRLIALFTTAFLLLVVFSPLASAHSPEFPSGNESLGDATTVNDPTKSWAIYSELHEGGEAQYYLLPMKKGENISVQLIAPRISIERGFLPSLALMGPGISTNDTVPSFVEVPSGAGVRVVQGVVPSRLDYEPFSPSAFYDLGSASLEAPQDGNYYVAVFDQTNGGNYCIAVGLRESFTIEEWLLIPFQDISIYQWEGQTLLQILAPPVLAFLVGVAVLFMLSRNRSKQADLLWALASVAGLLMIASGTSILFQMAWALSQSGLDATFIVTLLFGLIPIALGLWSLRIAYRRRTPEGFGWKVRLALIIIGGLGLLLWGGYLAGPILVFIAAILPSDWLKHGLGKNWLSR